jgi:hypothetical protein
MQFNAADDCLLFFVDDTGHEDLDGQPVYGLGGCSMNAMKFEEFGRGDIALTVDPAWRVKERSDGRRFLPKPACCSHGNSAVLLAARWLIISGGCWSGRIAS